MNVNVREKLVASQLFNHEDSPDLHTDFELVSINANEQVL